MTYNELLEILLSEDVYDKLKQNEQEIFELISELRVYKGFEQNSKWHIYDVYEHILHVVSGVDNNIYLRLSALFHDIGKPSSYTEDDNKVGHFYNHWNESIKIFKKYQENFGLSNEEIILITNLIFYYDINIDKITDEELNNMIISIGILNVSLLFSLKRADLLAQAPEFHSLLSNINNQEQKVKNYNLLKIRRKINNKD